MILGVFTISGHSMLPTLKPHDKVVVTSLVYLFSTPRIGDIIVFKNNSKIIIKRIRELKNEMVLTEGDNIEDSKKMGWIEKKDIIGKVIYKL